MGFCTKPAVSTRISVVAPVLMLTPLMREPQVFAPSQLYLKPADGSAIRVLVAPWPIQPANCSSRKSFRFCVVNDIVTRLLPNGCTVKASR